MRSRDLSCRGVEAVPEPAFEVYPPSRKDLLVHCRTTFATDSGVVGASGDPGEGSVELAPGQTAEFGLQIKVKAVWGPFDTSRVVQEDPYGRYGCQPITFTATNDGTSAFLVTNGSDDQGSAAEPRIGISMTAGDTLREVGEVSMPEPNDWPHRLKPGKSATWTQCFMSNEHEQHLKISAITTSADVPLAAWARQ